MNKHAPDVVPQVGDVKTFELGPYTHKQIREYCRRVGDTNPFHSSPDSAARMCARLRPIPHGSVVVPGMLLIDEFPKVIIGWLGLGSAFSGIRRLSLHTPAFSGEKINVELVVKRRVQSRDGAFYECATLARLVGLEKTVLTSQFRMFVPTPGVVV